MANNELRDFALNILQWNSQSIRPKITEFESLLFKDQIHIAIICETWLEEHSFLNISQYNIYRKDRADGYGGVAIIVHKSITSELKVSSISNTGIEILHVKINNCKYLKNIVSVYCPSSIQTRQCDWDELFSLCSQRSLIVGDFNGHHSNWSYKTDTRGIQIMDSALENGFIPINDGSATRVKYVNNVLQQSSPDITFSSSDIVIHFSWRVLSDNLGSDHLIINIKMNYQDTVYTTRKYNFKKANWLVYRSDIEQLFSNIDPNICDIHLMYSTFISIIKKSADKNIPIIKVCNSPQNKFKPKPYWNPHLSKVVAERRLALKQFRRNPTPENLAVLENKTLKAKQEIRQAKTKCWQEFCSAIDGNVTSSEMWRKMKWIKGYRQTGSFVPLNKKSELLHSLTPDSSLASKPLFISNNVLLESEFTFQELESCIKKKDTAPGDDDITYSMIFNLPYVAKAFLLRIFNKIFFSGCIPNEWRTIKIIAIPKVGNTSKLRPISLISCPCKIFHLMLARRIEWFIEHNSVLSPSTTGFRRGQSCLDSLAQLITNIQVGFTKNWTTLACFLDIENAYNNVLIDSVVKTLDNLKVGSRICNYLWEFLKERHLIVKDDTDVRGGIMRWTNRGLAQGDPISPLLFNIVSLEICNKINNNNLIKICQYADDFVLFVSSKKICDSVNNMQLALNYIVETLSSIGLELSTSKSQVCLFSRGYRRQNVQLYLNDTLLVAADSIKYLGIWLDPSLRWGKHINELYEKCQKMLNIIKVLAGSNWGMHPLQLRLLYISLIRSRIDYGCVFYDSSVKSRLCKLEKIQNKAMRIIGSFIKTTPIHVMESELCLPPLHIRRKFLAFKFCLKVKSCTNCMSSKCLSDLGALRTHRYWSNKKIPALMDTYNITKEENIYSSNPLDMYKLNFWCSYIPLKNVIKINLQTVNMPKKSYESNCLRIDILQELNYTYNGWHKLFTDGSKSSQIGAAFYDATTKTSGCFKLVSNVSIMTAELYAISEALSYVAAFQHVNIVIFTDSKSALQHLARCASGQRGVSIAFAVLRKIHTILLNNINLVLQWIPSHIGLKGNEEADRLAKIAATSGIEVYILPVFSEILPKFKNYCYNEWKEMFKSKDKGLWYKTIQSEPPRVPWFSDFKVSRRMLVTSFRIRSGHMPLRAFAYLMKKVESPYCLVCDNKVEDVYHLLTECVRNESERSALYSKLNINKLDVGIFNFMLTKPMSPEAALVYSLINL